MRLFPALILALCACHADEFFPEIPPDIEVSLFASEPLVRNPCAIAFDAKGRLCVGMGPQYRNPRPDTPGDSVFILIDDDGDGRADRRKEFATGFNSIQGLAWKGNALWIANSPDLTIARDLDGDDEADDYTRVYTDLGNLEHALHGLNWAPDGKLYMSKGNSKGLTLPPHRVAPRPFRELWGARIEGLPDFPEPVRFDGRKYQRNYHDPQDDWGREGGVLRCEEDGSNLEIVARGFRNPWDITFDDGFNWLGTDNDQIEGDKIFSPFPGAHFGWGHPWSFDWKGEDHLPTVPASGPLFEGSGAGLIYCGIGRYPEKYRGVFFINDWLRREIYIYRPKWDGARLIANNTPFDLLATAGQGRSMERSQGRKFDPVDIEIGPDEAIYISSWGREYGAKYKEGEVANEGRIYRIWPKSAQPRKQWGTETLIQQLGSHLPVWRINAQEELIRRGAADELFSLVGRDSIPKALETWAVWTLGRMNVDNGKFAEYATDRNRSLNLRIQSIRILAHRKSFTIKIRDLLDDPEPRIRLEAILALRQSGDRGSTDALIARVAKENDRIVYYASWGALGSLLPEDERRLLLSHQEPGVRRAAVLSLLEADALDADQLRSLAGDSDSAIVSLARRRLSGKAETIIRGKPLPKMTSSRNKRATVEEVLPLVRSASAQRGRDLFFGTSGAGCIACHRLEEIGNVFAPDLQNIGSRADAEFIVRSIVDPSAAITEGFASHTVTTRDGDEYTGVLVEETGASVKLALGNGETISLPTTLISKRASSRQSAMPSNYSELLSGQEIADLASFLVGPVEFSIQKNPGEFVLRRAGIPVATYLFDHPQLTRPALVNIRTASGIPVTREFPAPESADHRWMHPGIALSFGWLDGHDYWRMKARVKHVAFTQEPIISDRAVRWSVRNEYQSGEQQAVVCHEETTYQLASVDDGLLLKIDSQFFNDERNFSFGDQEESGLCLRISPALSVRNGTGAILNDRGEKNEAGTWGKEFNWIDYSGFAENKTRVGLRLIPHPENPRVSWSHSRDYGVLVANPFPRQPRERAEPFVQTPIRKGERFRLRYSLLIHESKKDGQ